jgi:hypothetical protein
MRQQAGEAPGGAGRCGEQEAARHPSSTVRSSVCSEVTERQGASGVVLPGWAPTPSLQGAHALMPASP